MIDLNKTPYCPSCDQPYYDRTQIQGLCIICNIEALRVERADDQAAKAAAHRALADFRIDSEMEKDR